MRFNRHWADFARYLPALNNNFVEFAHSAAGLRNGLGEQADLNILDPASPHYFAPDVLYTAAFAVGTSKPNILTARDRSQTFVLGDSAGFSLQSGAITASHASYRPLVLAWQEKHCDVGLPLDVPTAAIRNPKSGYTSVKDCFDATFRNTEWVIKNRSIPVLTMCCVYQGSTTQEADKWATDMAPLQRQLEGIAIAGATRLDMASWIKRILDMIADGRFDRVRHIHFLGTNQPRFAVLATALQRGLRQALNRQINVTFDSSTSFTFVQKFGQIATGLLADGKSFRMTTQTLPGVAFGLNQGVLFPYRSPLADLCTVGDFMPGTSAFSNPVDAIGANMLSHHSVYAELSAIVQANRLVDMHQTGPNSAVPYNIILAVELINAIFCGGPAVGKSLAELKMLLAAKNRLHPDEDDRV